MQNIQREENPFETAEVATEWIRSVENEKGLIRDKEIYPYLQSWVSEVRPTILVEVGSGQGICSDKIGNDFIKYIGIEPSNYLVERAISIYSAQNKIFTLGNAYSLPLKNQEADAIFSVNVWFHLADINKAGTELSRILKGKGKFLIVTVNPRAYEEWESFYFDHTKVGNKIVGKVHVPINPLSCNVFFAHTFDEIKESVESNSLRITKIEGLGNTGEVEQALFVAISGEKI